MKIQQLSLFLENQPGQLVAPCRVMAEAGVNIVTLNLADTQEFGIMRLIVDDHQKAKRALSAAGFVVNVTEVLAIEVPDRPGGLAELLAVIDEKQLAIEYMYAFTAGGRGNAVMIFRFPDTDRAVELLQGAGLPVVAPVYIYGGRASA